MELGKYFFVLPLEKNMYIFQRERENTIERMELQRKRGRDSEMAHLRLTT